MLARHDIKLRGCDPANSQNQLDITHRLKVRVLSQCLAAQSATSLAQTLQVQTDECSLACRRQTRADG